MPYRTTEWTHRIAVEPKKVKAELMECLKRHSGNVTHAAEELGLSRQGLYNYLAKLEVKLRGGRA